MDEPDDDLPRRYSYSFDFSVQQAPPPGFNLNKRKNVEKLNDDYMKQIKKITPDLTREVILNVLAYAKQLKMPGKNDIQGIDENIFTAQMAKYFNISDRYLILRIFEVIKVKKRMGGSASVLNFAKLVCIFICESMQPKIDYAFHVYDVRHCGYLNTSDLESALRPLIRYTSSTNSMNDMLDPDAVSDAAEDMEKKTLNEIVNLLLSMIDSNNDRTIDLGEFHAIVNKYPLMLECLGPVLPGKKERDDFVAMMTDRSTFEISAQFRHERKISLNDPTSDKTIFDEFYPFQLEFP